MKVRYDEVVPALKRLLPSERVNAVGERVGFIQRLRTITASSFVWSVVLSRFGHGLPAFEQARQWYARLTKTMLWPRPFQMRFKKASVVRLFERVFEEAVQPWRAGMQRRPQHPLAKQFPDVVTWDSTVVQVADCLRGHFKGTRSAAASLKVLLAVSVWGLMPLAAQVVAGHRHDNLFGPPLALFRKGTLLLFDKGFGAYQRLREIGDASLFYLCPMRANGIAHVVKVHAGPSRARTSLRRSPDGVALRSLLPQSKRISETWDLEVLLRPAPHRVRKPTVRTRLVIVPGPKGEQRPYLTNLDPKTWSPSVLRELYRLRWQTELVFKELKQDLNLESVPSKDPHAVQTLIWGSLIALAVSRTVAGWLCPRARRVGLTAKLRPMVLTRALRATVRLLGRALVAPLRSALPWLSLFAEELIDETRRVASREDSFKRLIPLMKAA